MYGCKFAKKLILMSNLNFKIMNALRNRVTLIGNLGMDPEVKTTDGGKKYTHFSLATTDSFKNADGQKVNETTWHNITAWNGLAETAGKFLKKGKEVCVEGRIVYRTYEDKKGVTKNATEIVLTDLLLLRNGAKAGKDEE
jgi:single-strand DNA-binding protein